MGQDVPLDPGGPLECGPGSCRAAADHHDVRGESSPVIRALLLLQPPRPAGWRGGPGRSARAGSGWCTRCGRGRAAAGSVPPGRRSPPGRRAAGRHDVEAVGGTLGEPMLDRVGDLLGGAGEGAVAAAAAEAGDELAQGQPSRRASSTTSVKRLLVPSISSSVGRFGQWPRPAPALSGRCRAVSASWAQRRTRGRQLCQLGSSAWASASVEPMTGAMPGRTALVRVTAVVRRAVA